MSNLDEDQTEFLSNQERFHIYLYSFTSFFSFLFFWCHSGSFLTGFFFFYMGRTLATTAFFYISFDTELLKSFLIKILVLFSMLC